MPETSKLDRFERTQYFDRHNGGGNQPNHNQSMQPQNRLLPGGLQVRNEVQLDCLDTSAR
jgi:hypothetical protein